MQNSDQKYFRLEVLLVSFLILLFVFSMCFFSVQSDDLYMYLAIARRYFTEGHFSMTDPFLYPLDNYPWVIMHQWLGYLAFYGVYKLGGFDLIIVFKTLLYALIFLAPAFILKIKNKFALCIWAVVTVLSLYASSFRLMERTSIFSELFLVLVLCIVLRESLKPSRLKYALPLIFLFWVNIHPSFVLGWLVCGFYLILNIKNLKNVSEFLTLFGVSILVCLINPETVNGVLYPFKFALTEATVYKNYYFEWKNTFNPLFLKAAHNYFIVVLMVLSAAMLFFKRKHPSIWLCAGLSLFFIYYGLSAIRFVPVMCFSLAVIILFLCKDAEFKFKKNLFFSLGLVGLLGISVCNIVFGYNTISGPRNISWGEDSRFMPKGAVEFIDQNIPNPGNVFNTHVIGNYLSWKWDGRIKVFYHGFVTDTDFYLKEYVPFFDPKTFDQQVRKYDIRLIILDFYSINKDYLEMINSNPAWRGVYIDDHSVVFVRRDGD